MIESNKLRFLSSLISENKRPLSGLQHIPKITQPPENAIVLPGYAPAIRCKEKISGDNTPGGERTLQHTGIEWLVFPKMDCHQVGADGCRVISYGNIVTGEQMLAAFEASKALAMAMGDRTQPTVTAPLGRTIRASSVKIF